MLPIGGSSSQETSECQYSPFALGIGVGMDRENLRMSFRPGRAGMNMQFTEISAEPLMGFHVERLIAEKQHRVLRESLMQLLDLAVAERLGQRDALDIGAHARRNPRDTDGSIAHGLTFDCGAPDGDAPSDPNCACPIPASHV